MSSPPPVIEFYGPPEAQDNPDATPGILVDGSPSGFGPTNAEPGLSGSVIDLQADGSRILGYMGVVGAVLQLAIDLLIGLANWISGFFDAPPTTAKTAGTGTRLAHQNDPITQWLGLQLLGGAGLGRVLSEGGWPKNFGGLVLANLGAFMELVNSEPPNSLWHVRNTPQTSITRFRDPPRQFRVGPVSPPPGAPYSASIIIDGFFSEFVRDANSYQARFGFAWPTPDQILQFLHDSPGIVWNDQRVTLGLLADMRQAFLTLWVQDYQLWLNQHKPIPPGPTPDPCGLPENVPCPPPANANGDQLTDLIGAESTYLYYIARGLQRLSEQAASPQDAVCCANVVIAINSVAQQIQLIVQQFAGVTSTPIDLTQIIAALGALVTSVQAWPLLWTQIGNELTAVLKAVGGQIALVAKEINTTGIVEKLDQANTLNDIPQALLNQFVQDGIIPPQYSPFLQGMPTEWLKNIWGALRRWSPSDDFIKYAAGDKSSYDAAMKRHAEMVKVATAELYRTGEAIGGIAAPTGSKPVSDTFANYLKATDAIITPVLQPLLSAIEKKLSPTPGFKAEAGTIGVDPIAPVADATGIAITAAAASWILSYGGIDAGEPLAHIAELIAGAVGFEELRDVEIGPLIRNGIAAVAELKAKYKFRQTVPGRSEIANLVARGLFPAAAAPLYLGFNGVSDALQPIELAAGYHGMQARQIIRLIETGLFTATDLTDELTFSGMRPASQARTQLAAPYLATSSQRAALRSAIEASYEAGIISDAQLTQLIDSAEHNTDRDSLILTTAQIKKRIQLTRELEASYTTLHQGGVTDVATFTSQLQGLNLQPEKVRSLVAVAEAHLTVTLKRQADAAEKQLIRETVNAERRAAIENYKRGTINLVGLGAALVATGYTIAQAAAITDLVVLETAGNLRWIYGLQKVPADAALLKDRVDALLDQRKRELIDGSQFVKSLQGLGIPEHYQNALLARANAQITPKKDAFVTTVETLG